MGASGKPVDGGLDSDGRKYVIAGIPLRGPLKPVFTKGKGISRGDDEDEECSTTPTAEGARIPAVLPCPQPPRKRKPSLKCNYGGGVREFFTPPDLESVFIRRHVEKAN